MQPTKRYLLVTADDFGIGPETTRGILDLAGRGIVAGSVLMVNSPYAAEGVKKWAEAGRRLELGWHPVLSNDRPLLPASEVPSLVDAEGRFHGLGTFLKHLYLGKIDARHVRAELRAQHARCTELLGHRPWLVNMHHHLHVFEPVATALQEILAEGKEPVYLRVVREPWPLIGTVSGARVKRLYLNWNGRRAARKQRQRRFIGSDWLIGVTDPRFVHDPRFFRRLIRKVPGRIVELTCHPGYRDNTLIGRDCTADDGMVERRVKEFELLGDPGFRQACEEAGFERISPARLMELHHDVGVPVLA